MTIRKYLSKIRKKDTVEPLATDYYLFSEEEPEGRVFSNKVDLITAAYSSTNPIMYKVVTSKLLS